MITLLYHISELQSFLVACYYYRDLRDSFMRWFTPYLGFVFFADFSIYVQLKVFHFPYSGYPRMTLYMILILQAFFYGYIFYELTDSRILKKAVVFMWLACIPTFLLSFFLGNNETSKDLMLPVITSNIFLAVIALFYLYLIILKNDNINLVCEHSWWLAVGIAVFSSCVSIGHLLYDFILQNNLRLFGTYLYNVIPQFMSLILYSFISVSIILYVKKAKRKSAFL
jgi:hypothetical protein